MDGFTLPYRNATAFDTSENKLFMQKIPNLYLSHELKDKELSSRLANYNRNYQHIKGVYDNNDYKNEGHGIQEGICFNPLTQSQNISDKIFGLNSRDRHKNALNNNSLQIKYSLNDKKTTTYPTKISLSTINNSFKMSIDSPDTPQENNGLNNENIVQLSPEKFATSNEYESMKDKDSSPSDTYSSPHIITEYIGQESKEKGEFGASLDPSLPKAYNPALIERRVYNHWEENGYFKPKNNEVKRFSMVLPPPNVTGTLHLGHAITLAIQDALARWKRMEGTSVLWIPGLDHAGIATQTVVEKWLKRNKRISRHDLGREGFLKEVNNWKNEKGNVIKEQLRKFGASLDWSREIFTMEKRHNEAVVEAIVRLWNAGLVYRKEALINWSCELSSAISDIEVERFEVSGPTPVQVPGYDKPVIFGELVEIAFKVCDSEEEVVVATTRPETMLGDVAVAVHPEDIKYKHLHGRMVWHPLRRTTIPIIADETVDFEFGTGAVKITPGHSPTDCEIAQRHKLGLLPVINDQGFISSDAYDAQFKGMKRFDARKAVKKELTKLGLLRAVKPHNMQIPICSRSGDVVEYLLRYQWFVSTKTMAEKAAMAVRAGLLEIEPPNFNNTWFSFLDNIRDWCISRQLWWGHRIPMYHATAGHQSVWVAAPSEGEALAEAETLLGKKVESIIQDSDVLDTWFSSALYPLSALGWPKQTDDLKLYYPLDIMETGHDILFFWVARMVMLGTELTGELPFKKVLLHGIVCDAHGRKMSKSLGNVIHPEDVIYGKTLDNLNMTVKDNYKAGLMSAKERDIAIKGQQMLFPNGIPECGTDALRFTLLSHKTKNHMISFDIRECETNHHFLNKIWQSSRFALHWASILGVKNISEPQNPNMMDRWILSQLSHTVEKVTAGIKSADFQFCTAALKDFLYYTFCDYYVEAAKPVLRSGSDSEALNTCQTLLHCLDVGLRLSSPIMPFVTEMLYKYLPGHEGRSCMMASFPSAAQKWRDLVLDDRVQLGIDTLSAIRTLKNTNGFYKKHVAVEIETKKKEMIEVKSLIELLANSSVDITEWKGEARKQTVTNTVDDHTLVHISLKNISKEQYQQYFQTLMKKEAKIKKTLDKILEKTKKPNYVKIGKEAQSKVDEQIRIVEGELKSIQSYIELNKPTFE